MLSKCLEVFKTVVPFFMFIAPGLPMFERHFERVRAAYGVEVIQTAHPTVSVALKRGLYCKPRWSGPVLKQVDVETTIRKRTGIDWIAYGHRASDSIPRNAMLRRCQGFDPKGRRVYPIWDWSMPKVWGYTRARKLPLVPQIGGRRTSGVGLTVKSIIELHAASREDYEALRRMYPDIEAVVARAHRGEV